MREVRVNIDINCKPEKVIAAFIEAKMLQEWWGVERSIIEPKIGGSYCLGWKVSADGIKYLSTGIIRAYDPGKELGIGNFMYLSAEKPFLGPMTLSIAVKEKKGVSSVDLCQDGYGFGGEWDWYYEAVKNAWPVVVQDLKNYLENL